jgi:hypothetical protein
MSFSRLSSTPEAAARYFGEELLPAGVLSWSFHRRSAFCARRLPALRRSATQAIRHDFLVFGSASVQNIINRNKPPSFLRLEHHLRPCSFYALATIGWLRCLYYMKSVPRGTHAVSANVVAFHYLAYFLIFCRLSTLFS